MSFRSKRMFLVLPVILLCGFIQSDTDIYFKISKAIDIFGRVYKEVTLNYVDNVDPEEFMLAGIKGMLTSLDPYTNFIDENRQKDIDIITKGKYGGIGATIGFQNDEVTVVDLIEGYSAQRQGIRIGDIIEKVDGVAITKDNYEELGALLKKTPGSVVQVIIQRDGIDEEIIFNLQCEEIEIKNLSFYGFVPAESNNVYLKLSGFSRPAGEEIKNALLELKRQKEIKSVILDLRGNPGGLLDAAVDVCEKFLNRNTLVVTVKGRDDDEIQEYFSDEEPVSGNSRLAVLVDDGSASASEIVAGAIQDHDRGIILGTPSFGKGLVQTLIPLSYNTSLKITTGKYFTPSGRCIQKVDYSVNNKVLGNQLGDESTEFKTDNNRIVFSRGGIHPDSVVSNDSESYQIQNLLAQGMFFRFATNYFNKSATDSINGATPDELFNAFVNLLKNENYSYTSRAERLLTQLKNESEERYTTDIKNEINALEKKLAQLKLNELEFYKNDIVVEIQKELAARLEGRKGRIKEQLKNDKQFEIAFGILNNESTYNKLLNSVE